MRGSWTDGRTAAPPSVRTSARPPLHWETYCHRFCTRLIAIGRSTHRGLYYLATVAIKTHRKMIEFSADREAQHKYILACIISEIMKYQYFLLSDIAFHSLPPSLCPSLRPLPPFLSSCPTSSDFLFPPLLSPSTLSSPIPPPRLSASELLQLF